MERLLQQLRSQPHMPAGADAVSAGRQVAGFSFSELRGDGDYVIYEALHGDTLYSSVTVTAAHSHRQAPPATLCLPAAQRLHHHT